MEPIVAIMLIFFGACGLGTFLCFTVYILGDRRNECIYCGSTTSELADAGSVLKAVGAALGGVLSKVAGGPGLPAGGIVRGGRRCSECKETWLTYQMRTGDLAMKVGNTVFVIGVCLSGAMFLYTLFA